MIHLDRILLTCVGAVPTMRVLAMHTVWARSPVARPSLVADALLLRLSGGGRDLTLARASPSLTRLAARAPCVPSVPQLSCISAFLASGCAHLSIGVLRALLARGSAVFVGVLAGGAGHAGGLHRAALACDEAADRALRALAVDMRRRRIAILARRTHLTRAAERIRLAHNELAGGALDPIATRLCDVRRRRLELARRACLTAAGRCGGRGFVEVSWFARRPR